MPSIVCSAQASYKKLAGLLELTDSHLQWTKAGEKAPAVKVPTTEAACKWRNHVFRRVTDHRNYRPNCFHIFVCAISTLAQQGWRASGTIEDWTRER